MIGYTQLSDGAPLRVVLSVGVEIVKNAKSTRTGKRIKMNGTSHTVATKKITACGTSLVINVTKECRFLGVELGDYVNVIIETIPQETDNQ